jgi:hypothetical protein
MNRNLEDETITDIRKQITEDHLSKRLEQYRLWCLNEQAHVTGIVDKLVQLYQYERDNNEFPLLVTYPNDEDIYTSDAVTEFIEIMDKAGYQCEYHLEWDFYPWIGDVLNPNATRSYKITISKSE